MGGCLGVDFYKEGGIKYNGQSNWLGAPGADRISDHALGHCLHYPKGERNPWDICRYSGFYRSLLLYTPILYRRGIISRVFTAVRSEDTHLADFLPAEVRVENF